MQLVNFRSVSYLVSQSVNRLVYPAQSNPYVTSDRHQEMLHVKSQRHVSARCIV
jgi:hypothetical protein